MVRHDPRPQKITFGEMRAAGTIGILSIAPTTSVAIRSRWQPIDGMTT